MHSEASAVTLEPTELMYLESERIREIILDKPCIAVNLIHILGNVLKNTLELTHEEIASLISSTRQTLTTILNRLEKSGIIELGRKTIKIKDMERLKELSI